MGYAVSVITDTERGSFYSSGKSNVGFVARSRITSDHILKRLNHIISIVCHNAVW